MLEVIKFSDGSFGARPKGQLGTCGYYPFSWSICYGPTESEAKRIFWSSHMGVIARERDRRPEVMRDTW